MSFKIWNDGDSGRNCHIEIDGEDVSASFHHLQIVAGLKTAVEIELDPIVAEVPERRFDSDPDDGATRLVFGTAETRELLVRHGWTPPSDGAA
jgi:hypothetical protein